jgi:hypothetical protein
VGRGGGKRQGEQPGPLSFGHRRWDTRPTGGSDPETEAEFVLVMTVSAKAG